MFKYLPHTEQDIKDMLKVIGVSNIDELFSEIPEGLLGLDLDVPNSHSELEIYRRFNELASKNKELVPFVGAGAYDHYTPSVIRHLIERQEFLTAYTPYQPEISQGTLQYIFEYQSLICELTGMDVSNASMYDGATATAEAMFMAIAAKKRDKILVSKTVNPNIIEVLKTYAKYRKITVDFIDEENGVTSLEDFKSKNTKEYAGLIVQSPNFYGAIEDLSEYREILDETKVNSMKSKLHSMEAKLENTCSKHKKDLRFFESHDDCPVCQQVIDEAYKSTMMSKKAEKIQELESALGQIKKDITSTETRLSKINEIMVAIREKELLINRYETSISEIKKYMTIKQNEIDELSDDKFTTGVATGQLTQLQEQLTEADTVKIKYREEKTYLDTARYLMQDTGIKTKIIKQYLPIMNQYINKNLADMDFFVNFTLDEEFNESIKSRHRDDFQYHSFREGEK